MAVYKNKSNNGRAVPTEKLSEVLRPNVKRASGSVHSCFKEVMTSI